MCDRIAIVDHGVVVARDTVDAMVGGSSVLRLRLANVTAAVEAALSSHGPLAHVPPWFAIEGIAENDVPGIVAEIVALGAAIYAVELARATLEERIIQVLQPASAHVDDRIANHA